MKASNLSDAQIALVVKQAEGGASVAEVCRKAGIGPSTQLLAGNGGDVL